jgi:LPS-assembly lipoprotein
MSWSERDRVRLLAALTLVSALGAAGCGFRLRGTPQLPPELATTYIQADDRYTPFYRELVTRLRQGGARLTDDPTAARAVIQVLSEDTGRRLLSVSARNVPTEYEVFYRVRFLVRVDGREAVPVEQLALTRDQTFNEDFVLGKAGEEQVLREAMARDLVALVTRRLASIRSLPPADAGPAGPVADPSTTPPG